MPRILNDLGPRINYHMTFYRHILKKAWEIAIKNKYLWFFGLFTALLGNGGEYEIFLKTFSEDNQELFPNLNNLTSTGIFSAEGLRNTVKTAVTDPVNFSIVMGILLVSLVLVAFLVWLVIISQAALVNSSAKIIQNKKTTFRDSLAGGIDKFWPVFILNLINRGILIAILALLFLLIVKNSGLVSITYIISFIILIPLAIIFSFIIKYSVGYVVVKGQKLTAALQNGMRLFKENWIISIEMALLLALINFGLGFIAVIVILVLAIPFLFLAFVFLNFLGSMGGFLAVAVLGLIVFIGLIFTTGAIIATFQVSAWTGLFLELLNKGGVAKIVRIFGKDPA